MANEALLENPFTDIVKPEEENPFVEVVKEISVLDILTEATIKTEGLVPGQTPLRINPKNEYKNTVQGIPLDKSIVKPKGRENFYFVKPGQEPEVIRRQWKRYFTNPEDLGVGLTKESTIEDAVKKFDQQNPQNKLKWLEQKGIDIKKKLKDFDISQLNPFHVGEAEAAEQPTSTEGNPFAEFGDQAGSENPFAEFGGQDADVAENPFADIVEPEGPVLRAYTPEMEASVYKTATPTEMAIFDEGIKVATSDILKDVYGEKELKRLQEGQRNMRFLISRAPRIAMLYAAPIYAAGFELLQQGKNLLVPAIQGGKYSPFETRLLTELLPPEVPAPVQIAANLGEWFADIALVGGAINLAKQGLLEGSIKEVGAKLTKAGYGEGSATIPKEVIREAVKGTTLGKEAVRFVKAKKITIPPKGRIPTKAIIPTKPATPKPAPGSIVKPKTLLSWVRSKGGLNPAKVGKDFNINEDFKQFGLLSALNKATGGDLDDLALTAIAEGVLEPPPPELKGKEAEWMMTKLKEKTKIWAQDEVGQLDQWIEAEEAKYLEAKNGYEKETGDKFPEESISAELETTVNSQAEIEATQAEVPDWVTEMTPFERAYQTYGTDNFDTKAWSKLSQKDQQDIIAAKTSPKQPVEQIIQNNAEEVSSLISAQEKAGFARVSKGKEPNIQDPAIRATLYAGRKKHIPIVGSLKIWAQRVTDTLTEIITAEFEPKLKEFPQLKDDIRTGLITAPRQGMEQSEVALGGVIGDLTKQQEDTFFNVLGLKDFLSRGEGKLDLPRDLSVDMVRSELERLLTLADPATLKAVDRYEKLMQAVGEGLVEDGKLDPASLKSSYFPHYVLDYLPDWWESASPFLPRRLRQPYMPYTKKAVGSAKDIAISREALLWHLGSVFTDAAVDNWAVNQLTKYDITPSLNELEHEQVFGLNKKGKLVPPQPNRIYEIDGKKYRGFQYKPGRMIHSATVINPKLQQAAVEQGMTNEEWAASQGPRGGKPIYTSAALGKWNKTYLIPQEVYNRFDKLKGPASDFPQIYSLIAFTSQWKRITLDWAGIPFQAGNFFGDAETLFRTAPGAMAEVPTALSVLKNLRHPEKMTDWQREVARIAHEKDVFGAGFVQEYARITPMMTPKGFLERIEHLSSLREGILRVAMLSYQLQRINKGLPVVAPEFRDRIAGLDPVSKAGFVARNFAVDYAALPDWYRRYARGIMFPFITYWHFNAKNWAQYIKNAPLGWVAKFLAPAVAIWTYNNTGDRKKIEERLPEYFRWRSKHIILKGYDLDYDGESDKALVWSMQAPSDMAGAWIGVERIADKVTLIRAGVMTPEEAAKAQLNDLGLGGYRTLRQLLNPMAQFFLGVAANEDPRTKQKVIPRELENLSEYAKYPYYSRYFAEKVFTPYAQYMKESKGTDLPSFGLLTGPLDIMRAFGFYMVDLTRGDTSVEFDRARKLKGDYADIMLKIENKYIQGKELDEVVEEAYSKGVQLTAEEVERRLDSTRVQILKTKELLRTERDKAKRQELEVELKKLNQRRIEEYKQTIPKAVRGNE